MASKLSVIFDAVDNISAKLSAMAGSGKNLTKEFRDLEDSANSVFDNIQSGAGSAADSLEKAASSTDYWTDAIGNYDKGAMQAIYTTQELVDMGYMTEDALQADADAADQAADEMEEFSDAADDAADKAEDFGDKSTDAVKSLGSLLTSAGIAKGLQEIASAFEDCTEKGESFETSIAQLQTIAGSGMIDTLQSDIMDLSNDTGSLSDSLSEVAYNAISAGTAVEDSVDMAQTASGLAVAGFTDTSSALSVLTTAVNAYGDSAGTAEHISDSLIQVQNLGVTTVAELSSQMGKAIASASAYNVSLENLESAYISTTKAGINTAESTTYISSMLKELGDSGSDVASIITERTGMSFGQLMDSGASLGDALEILLDEVNGDSEALMNLWSSAEAGKAANAILSQGIDNFNANLEACQNSANATADAYAIMADTTEYAHDRVDNAANNLQVTIGSVLNPTLKGLYNIGADILIGAQEIVKEHPVIVKVITSLTLGVAAFAATIAVYEAATSLATLTTKLFGDALLATPLGPVAIALGLVVAGVTALALTYGDATDASDELTYKSKEQEKQLNELNEQYDEAVRLHGALSTEAGDLAVQIDQLEGEFGESGETIAQFGERVTALQENLASIHDTYEQTVNANNSLEDGSITLVSELFALQNQTDLTDTQLQLMNGIVDQLNSSYSDLGLTVNDTTGKLNYSIADLYKFITEAADQSNQEAAITGLTQVMSGYQEVKDAAAQAADEAAAAQAEYDEIADAYVKAQSTIIQPGVKNPYEDQFLKAGSALDELQETAETASAAYDDMIDQITEYCTQLGYSDDEIAEFIASLEDSTDAALDFADGMQSTEEPVVEFSDAVSTAVDSVSEQVQKLTEEYDDVYSSAYESFSGQYELWETADEVATTSVDNIMAAMQSQEEYWESYAANLENLAGRNIEGLSDMVASMDDGSAASASALAAMADASDEQLQSMVEQYQSLQDAQSQTADDVAELETNFSTTMEQLEQDLEETIDNMNMEDDAATAAKNTMDAYVQTILDSKSSAASAADQVAKATAAALGAYDPSTVLSSSYTLTPSHVTMPEHALGTTNAEDAFIAGENGPELILGRSGSTVFPSEETDRIINAVSDRTDNPQITTLTTADSVSTAQSNSTGQASESASEKKVTISLEGAGSISISGQADKESVWESMKDDIKATFMSILQEEIYEEGDMAYEF